MDNQKTVIDEISEIISTYSFSELITSIPEIYSTVADPVHLAQAKALFLHRADELGERKSVQEIIRGCEREKKNKTKNLAIHINQSFSPAFLDLDKNGMPEETISNFYNIMLQDDMYQGIRFNLISGRAELPRLMKDGSTITDAWNDTDDSASQHYIEETYRLYSPQKHQAAIRMLFRAREYNPIQDLVESFVWDGVSRIEEFLPTWMLTENTPYTREVSRLIFAGGIHRLYHPGCKFDDVVVLVGENQGEGKSTLAEWLAVNPQWYGVQKHIEGKEALEEISGKWVCEIAELSAFKKAEDVEAIKAFVTIDRDRYRRPYDKYPVDYPRRCIFIGTTNQSQFLVDKTGNRRFYPVTVYQNGYWLRDHEEECRAYIEQCWAEARERFKKGEMPPFATKSLAEEYRKQQDAAMEDDWRVGKIQDYLRRFNPGDRVCAVQIFRECISPDASINPKRADSLAIGQIMSKQVGWKKSDMVRFDKYGVQRCWRKDENAPSNPQEQTKMPVMEPDDLPF